MKGPKMDSVGGIPVNQNRKIINKFNLNTENSGLGDFSRRLPYASCGGHYGDGTIEKSDDATHVGVRSRHCTTEDGENGTNYGKLINSDTTGEVGGEPPIVCHYGKHCRRDVPKNSRWRESEEKLRQCSYEGRTRSRRYVSESRVESDKHGKFHKLLAFPCKNNSFADARNVCDGYHPEKEELTTNALRRVLNIHASEETGAEHSYEPYVFLPKHIYCLNQQSRKRGSDEGDLYYKTPPVDVSVETSLTDLRNQLRDEDLINEIKRRKIELPQVEGNKIEIMESQEKQVAEVKQDSMSEPSDTADDGSRLERKTSPVPDDGIQASDKEDKGNSNKFVKEIKYYEGNLNIFGGEDKKESPFLRITKTVTFEKERGGRPVEKTLGIDSWMQTDGDYDSEKDSNLSYGSSKNSDKGPSSLVPSLNDSYVETAKVCGECLKLLASKYGGEKIAQGNLASAEPGKLPDGRPDKSASADRSGQSGIATELIKNDFVRFIAELFLETVPKEIYNRMMGGSERWLSAEEYEVRVKSYDRGSAESCNLKTCKMRNVVGKSDAVQFQGVADGERAGGPPRNECTCADPTCGSGKGQKGRKPSPGEGADGRRSSHASKSALETPEKEDENTYDCQITLNGKKISVKVNKSVEDLLLSGNIRNVLRVSPNESLDGPNAGSKQTVAPVQEGKSRVSGKAKVSGNCTCAEELASDGGKESNASKDKDYSRTRTSSVYGGARRGDSFTAIETGNYQKKASNDFAQSGRSAKPLITSPPPYGSDMRKTDKSRNEDKNVTFDNTKSLFWSNVEVFGKGNEERDRVSKTKKAKAGDCDSRNRMRSRVDYPCKMFPDRRPSCLQEKAKKHRGPGNGKQSEECFPLYWESQYLKYCDQMVSEDGGCTEKADKCKPILREGKACNFVHEIEKRVMVAPSFGQCNAMDAPRPLCIIKLADSENCDNSQYRDYTVANVTSVDLDSNPFDPAAITCRKCIETLRSCAKPIDDNWSDDKQYGSCGNVDLCKYYWNGITGKRSGERECARVAKGGNGGSTTRSYASLSSNCSMRRECGNAESVSSGTPTDTCRQSRNRCCANEECNPNKESPRWNADEKRLLCTESNQPKVSRRKLHGICFSVSRVTHRGARDLVDPAANAKRDDSEAERAGASTRETANARKKGEIQEVTKTSFTQTTRNRDGGREQETATEEQRSHWCRRPASRSGSNGSLASDSGRKSERGEAATVAPALSCPSQAVGKASSETIKSNVNIEVLLRKEEDASPSADSIRDARDGGRADGADARKKFTFKRSWRWWWRRWRRQKKKDSVEAVVGRKEVK